MIIDAMMKKTLKVDNEYLMEEAEHCRIKTTRMPNFRNEVPSRTTMSGSKTIRQCIRNRGYRCSLSPPLLLAAIGLLLSSYESSGMAFQQIASIGRPPDTLFLARHRQRITSPALLQVLLTRFLRNSRVHLETALSITKADSYEEEEHDASSSSRTASEKVPLARLETIRKELTVIELALDAMENSKLLQSTIEVFAEEEDYGVRGETSPESVIKANEQKPSDDKKNQTKPSNVTTTTTSNSVNTSQSLPANDESPDKQNGKGRNNRRRRRENNSGKTLGVQATEDAILTSNNDQTILTQSSPYVNKALFWEDMATFWDAMSWQLAQLEIFLQETVDMANYNPDYLFEFLQVYQRAKKCVGRIDQLKRRLVYIEKAVLTLSAPSSSSKKRWHGLPDFLGVWHVMDEFAQLLIHAVQSSKAGHARAFDFLKAAPGTARHNLTRLMSNTRRDFDQTVAASKVNLTDNLSRKTLQAKNDMERNLAAQYSPTIKLRQNFLSNSTVPLLSAMSREEVRNWLVEEERKRGLPAEGYLSVMKQISPKSSSEPTELSEPERKPKQERKLAENASFYFSTTARDEDKKQDLSLLSTTTENVWEPESATKVELPAESPRGDELSPATPAAMAAAGAKTSPSVALEDESTSTPLTVVAAATGNNTTGALGEEGPFNARPSVVNVTRKFVPSMHEDQSDTSKIVLPTSVGTSNGIAKQNSSKLNVKSVLLGINLTLHKDDEINFDAYIKEKVDEVVPSGRTRSLADSMPKIKELVVAAGDSSNRTDDPPSESSPLTKKRFLMPTIKELVAASGNSSSQTDDPSSEFSSPSNNIDSIPTTNELVAVSGDSSSHTDDLAFEFSLPTNNTTAASIKVDVGSPNTDPNPGDARGLCDDKSLSKAAGVEALSLNTATPSIAIASGPPGIGVWANPSLPASPPTTAFGWPTPGNLNSKPQYDLPIVREPSTTEKKPATTLGWATPESLAVKPQYDLPTKKGSSKAPERKPTTSFGWSVSEQDKPVDASDFYLSGGGKDDYNGLEIYGNGASSYIADASKSVYGSREDVFTNNVPSESDSKAEQERMIMSPDEDPWWKSPPEGIVYDAPNPSAEISYSADVNAKFKFRDVVVDITSTSDPSDVLESPVSLPKPGPRTPTRGDGLKPAGFGSDGSAGAKSVGIQANEECETPWWKIPPDGVTYPEPSAYDVIEQDGGPDQPPYSGIGPSSKQSGLGKRAPTSGFRTSDFPGMDGFGSRPPSGAVDAWWSTAPTVSNGETSKLNEEKATYATYQYDGWGDPEELGSRSGGGMSNDNRDSKMPTIAEATRAEASLGEVSENIHPYQSSGAARANEGKRITVCIRDDSTGSTTFYEIKRGTAMGKLFELHAKRKGFQPSSLQFRIQGIRVQDIDPAVDSPMSLKMQDGDEITCIRADQPIKIRVEEVPTSSPRGNHASSPVQPKSMVFQMARGDKMSKLFEMFADWADIDRGQLKFSFVDPRGQSGDAPLVLDPNQTPLSLGLRGGETIRCVNNEEPVAIRVVDEMGDETTIRIRKSTPMYKLFDGYLERKGYLSGGIGDFLFTTEDNGDKIDPNDTPGRLGLNSGEKIFFSRQSSQFSSPIRNDPFSFRGGGGPIGLNDPNPLVEPIPEADDKNLLFVGVSDPSGEETFFRIKKSTKFFKLFEMFAEFQGMHAFNLAFETQSGKPIDPASSPLLLKMESGEVLKCRYLDNKAVPFHAPFFGRGDNVDPGFAGPPNGRQQQSFPQNGFSAPNMPFMAPDQQKGPAPHFPPPGIGVYDPLQMVAAFQSSTRSVRSSGGNTQNKRINPYDDSEVIRAAEEEHRALAKELEMEREVEKVNLKAEKDANAKRIELELCIREEEVKLAEERRKLEAETKRLEDLRFVEERARLAAERRKIEAETKRIEELIRIEEEKAAEIERLAEETRLAEAARLETERVKAEAETKRLQELREAEKEARLIEERLRAIEAARMEEQNRLEHARRKESKWNGSSDTFKSAEPFNLGSFQASVPPAPKTSTISELGTKEISPGAEPEALMDAMARARASFYKARKEAGVVGPITEMPTGVVVPRRNELDALIPPYDMKNPDREEASRIGHKSKSNTNRLLKVEGEVIESKNPSGLSADTDLELRAQTKIDKLARARSQKLKENAGYGYGGSASPLLDRSIREDVLKEQEPDTNLDLKLRIYSQSVESGASKDMKGAKGSPLSDHDREQIIQALKQKLQKQALASAPNGIAGQALSIKEQLASGKNYPNGSERDDGKISGLQETTATSEIGMDSLASLQMRIQKLSEDLSSYRNRGEVSERPNSVNESTVKINPDAADSRRRPTADDTEVQAAAPDKGEDILTNDHTKE